MSRFVSITLSTLALSLAAACTGTPAASPTTRPPATNPPTSAPTGAPTPTAQPTPAPTAQPTPGQTAFPEGSVIVTFAVEQEQFKVLLTDPADIAIAQALLAGEEAPSIPNGLVVRDDPSVNAPWTWHLDPDSIEFADMTIEVCDGLPSYVEDGTVTSDRYCPWGAIVVAVEPANP